MTVGTSARRTGQTLPRVDTRSGIMTSTHPWAELTDRWPPVHPAHAARDLVFASAFVAASERWGSCADLPTLLAGIAAEAVTILPADHAAVVQYDGTGQQVLDIHLAPDLHDATTRDLMRAAAEEPWLTTPGSIPNLHLDLRWGKRGARLAASTWSSVLTFPLHSSNRESQNRISWISATPQAFVEHGGAAELFCRHADLAIRHLTAREHLTLGMTARHRIGLAQGILMAKHQLSADQVWQVLLRESQNTNTKLNMVAERVIRSGGLSSRPVAAPSPDGQSAGDGSSTATHST